MPETPLADTITGDSSANTISGRGGADTINGGDGNDTIYGHSAGATGAINATGVLNGLVLPVGGAATDADPGFLYIVEKESGIIFRCNPATGEKSVFLDVPQGDFTRDGERGVLGVAFHPDYADNGRFFVFLTDAQGDLQVREYHRSAGNPAVADTASTLVIEIARTPSSSNHNGGWIGFSPTDGQLYIATGDGGGSGDPSNNAQNLNSLLGKILRIDVDHGDAFPADATRNFAIPAGNPFVGVAGADEIWAYGLRNPWRNGFDPRNGDLYIGDVGQSAREEISYLTSTHAGANLGWHIMEGSIAYDPEPAPAPQPGDPSLIGPIFDYGRTIGTTITGGDVYVGTGNPDFVGQYVFADFGSNKLFTLRVVDGVAVDALDRTSQITGATMNAIVDFVTGTDGNLYAISIFGTVYRLDFAAGADDAGDVLNGEGGNDTIDGGPGADIINGGTGSDVLIGGPGADQLNGGDGDDAVYWDPADDLANVLGGAGSDALVFTGTAPTSFNLASHGFETGERRTADTQGQSWATQAEVYNPAWQLDAIVVTNDDGSHSVLDLDQGNAFSWTTAWAGYDVLGRLDTDVLINDDSSRAVRDLDQADAFDWEETWARYTPSGLLDVDVFTYDDGSTAVRDLDQANAFSWATAWASYDALGRLDVDVVTYDDGSRAVRDLDQADAFGWASMWWLYDDEGNLIAFQGINDDGSTF